MFQSTRLCEARLSTLGALNVHNRFNPRACVRRDGRSDDIYIVAQFQSTRLCEARLHYIAQSFDFRCFNPRACVRRDLIARYPN